MHHKMMSCIGSWNVGVKVTHYVLVLLSCRCNVNSDVRRCGRTHFVHPYLHLVDRIQIRIQEIYNVLVWKKDFNVSSVKGFDDFISVGVGKLSYSSACVTGGIPDSRIITSDVLCIAKNESYRASHAFEPYFRN